MHAQWIALFFAAAPVQTTVECTVNGQPWKAFTEAGAIGKPAVAGMAPSFGLTLRQEGKVRPSLEIAAPAELVQGKSDATISGAGAEAPLHVTWSPEGETHGKTYYAEAGSLKLKKHDTATGLLNAVLEVKLRQGNRFRPTKNQSNPTLDVSCQLKDIPVKIQQADGTYR
jgi:hypothetical protein